MLFIDALNRAGAQPTTKQPINKVKSRPFSPSKDSVDLSTAGNEVKEIHLDSQHKSPLSASSSIFANLIEHILNHLLNHNQQILSPEELNLENKEWQLFLQVPPSKPQINDDIDSNSYRAPEIKRQPPPKQLKFNIPVKPAYGNTVQMTVILSAHQGSPDTPACFSLLPKENTLPLLRTPYTPEFMSQQITYHHILLDLDGELDQLSNLYPLLTPPPGEEDKADSGVFGLRVWKMQGSQLKPIVLGDRKVGLLYVGHYQPIEGHMSSPQDKIKKANYLYTKA